MSQLNLSSQSILHVNAGLIVLPVGCDGVVLHPTVARLMHLYAYEYQDYKAKAYKGELNLGDTLTYCVQKQTTGLGVGRNTLASHMAFLVGHQSSTQPIKPSAFLMAYKALLPTLNRWVRYDNLRRMAIYLGGLSSLEVQKLCGYVADTPLPRVRITGHVDKNIIDELAIGLNATPPQSLYS